MIEKEKKSSVSKSLQTRLGVIFLGRRRPGFDMAWGTRMEERTRAWLKEAGYDLVEPAEKAVDDGSLRRAVQTCKESGAEALVLLQTTMGDGRLAPTLAQLWPDPPIFWATPENPEGDMISSCSLVGAHLWATTFRQMGHSFEVVCGDPGNEETQRNLRQAVNIAKTVRNLKTARLGMIGGQAPGFFTMSGDPFAIYQGLGVQVQNYTLLEFADVFNAVEKKAVAEDVAQVKALGLPYKDTNDDALPTDSRFYLAMRHFLDNENLDAMTIRCWPELPNVFGQWPYLALARLVDEGRAVACEGDADGALAAWIGESLGMGRCYLTDWLEHDHETITLWHGGCAPMGLCPPPGEPGGPRIALHFNSKKPTVVEAELRENMPVTILRFWRCDGAYYLTAREGVTIKPKRRLMGTNGLARLRNQDPGEWFEELCEKGMPHHVSVFEGHHAAMLRNLARVLRMKFI
jgi:L-fucose isomerase-like protein